MKKKKELGILGIIIIALSLYLFLYNPDRTSYQVPELPRLTGIDISKIEVSKGGTAVLLEKKDKKWQIVPEGYPADTDKVRKMLDVIEGLTLTALISKSKNYDRYDLDEDKKIIVRVWTGDTLKLEFDVGKAATSYRHTFVKPAGDHCVYHARDNFRDKFDQTGEALRDKTVLSFKQDEINEIHINDGNKTLVFSRKQAHLEDAAKEPVEISPPTEKTGEVWETTDGKKGDKEKLDGLLNTLASLKCKEYTDISAKDNQGKPVYTVRLKGDKEYALSLFDKAGEKEYYPATSSQNNYPFILSKWSADKVIIPLDKIVQKPNNK